MDKLVAYLVDNLMLDFEGDLTLDMVRDFLREDDSREAKAVLGKLVEDGNVSDMLICVADCLRDYVSTGVKPDVVRDQIQTYSES